MLRSVRSNVICVVAVLAACSTITPHDAPAEPRIYDVRAARFVGEQQLVAELAAVRYRLLGEVHDNPPHHEIRARLVAAIADTGARPALVLEQFDLDRDEALQTAQSARVDAEALATAGGLDRKAWKWPLHRPILDVALERGLPVRAGNLARAQLRADANVAVERDERFSGSDRLRAAHWTEAQALVLRDEIVESHCRRLPEAAVPRIVLAQRRRDAALAQALVRAATADGAVLIAGNGHVRADIAVPVYLRAPGFADPGARIVSVGFIEVRPDEERAREFPRDLVAAHPGFDYLWLTPPVERDDPCASLPRR